MGMEEFFSAIKKTCSGEEEYPVELLKARGFLLEDDKLALSNNSHPQDKEYLTKLLHEGNLGEIKEDAIILFPNGNMEQIFIVDNRIGFETPGGLGDWRSFVYYECAPKVPVWKLEPFVARYIKAISACGVRTFLSCDGNHPEMKKPPHEIIVEPEGEASKLWHKIICQRCLSSKFNLNWNATFEKISFSETNKWRTYIELNRAAEYLYNNRIALREIRWKAAGNISNSMAVHLPNAELARIFSDRANEQEFPV